MKLVVTGIVAVLVLFVVALAVAVGDDDGSADPTDSPLTFIEDLLPVRRLDGDDARAGGATCVQGELLVVARGGSCTFVVPDGVQRIALRRVAGSGRVLVEAVAPGNGLVQTLDTARGGPDADDPDAYRLAIVDEPTTLTVRCSGPQPCQLELRG